MPESRAHLIVKHPAWRLNKHGVAVVHPLIVCSVTPFWVLCMASIFLTTPTMLNPDGLLLWLDPVRYLSWALGALTFWVSLGLGKQEGNGTYNLKIIFVALLVATVLAVFTVIAVQFTVLSTFPRMVAALSPTPMTLRLQISNIHEIAPCRRNCLPSSITGPNTTRYGVMFENYPNIMAKLALQEPPEGFDINPSSLDRFPEPVAVEVSGTGNWVGLRVTEITRADR